MSKLKKWFAEEFVQNNVVKMDTPGHPLKRFRVDNAWLEQILSLKNDLRINRIFNNINYIIIRYSNHNKCIQK